MIQISNDDILHNHNLFIKQYRSAKGAPFLEDSFIKKSFPILAARVNRQYPYQVKLPKSVDEMLQGDFTPKRIITINEPIIGPYDVPIWFGDAKEGIPLRFGYKNGDSRYIANEMIGDKCVHGILAGATGQGKSVTLNCAIWNACLEFAPWELHLTLSDAKIVEFKGIAINNPFPHIESVAATSDVDYLISVLENKKAEMEKLNSVFVKAGEIFGRDVKNIMDFRDATGLTLPQNLIISDEFQTMFKMAGKKLKDVIACFDAFARLGRNTGYHLYMASQELGTDFPKDTLNNMTFRSALGCFDAVSNMILGNDAAKNNLGKKGYLLINTSPAQHDKNDNVLIRVPFMPGNQAREISSKCIALGEKFRVKPVLKFYDEQSYVTEDKYSEYLDQFSLSKNKIYLGEPSFVLEDPEQCVKINFTGKDVENICVLSPNPKHLIRYFKMLKANIFKFKDTNSLVLCANPLFAGGAELDSFNPKMVFDNKEYNDNVMIAMITSLIYRRRLCLAIDKIVFSNNAPKDDEVANKIFYSKFQEGSKEDTYTNRCRFYQALGLLQTSPEFRSSFGISVSSSGKIDEKTNAKIQNLAMQCITMFVSYHSANTKLTYEKLPSIYGWILGMDRVIHLGRDSVSRNVEAFKKLLQDCSDVNIRFLVFTTTFEDVTALKTYFGWYILDDLNTAEAQKIKCDDYPFTKSYILGVLYQPMDKTTPIKKFKKIMLNGEVPTG